VASLPLALREMPPNAFVQHRLYASDLLPTFGVASVVPRPKMSPLLRHHPDS
jgi:hypothetical protein